ncbi:Oidioi.mRNA.OKI2018_I69.chr2.g5920.t1.cds [Oikopleura dioica]|uniref:Oidioi.mRNA.OKI2018_I69.chr2.g5920.t1.cds n=1 Tax=Oikopleura dioica TaxID=34765 RepID=A0ABN7T687_OIKDI|nr:Oidioi.mRNA.OKI2018_I69.chr2.g5920.t1.cds [Oikopleura dioica]
MVENLLLLPDQQLTLNLNSCIEFLLLLCEDNSRDVRQGSSDALNQLTQFLPENILPRFRYILFKDLQKTVNLPLENWDDKTLKRVKQLLMRFSNLSSSIKPQKSKPFAQHIVPILNRLISSKEESVQQVLSDATMNLVRSLGHVFTEADFKDLETTLIAKITSKPLISPSNRESAAKSLEMLVHYNPEMRDILPAIILALKKLLEFEESYASNFELIRTLVDILKEEPAYSTVLISLELVNLLLKNAKNLDQDAIEELCSYLLPTFLVKDGELLPDKGLSRVSIKSLIVSASNFCVSMSPSISSLPSMAKIQDLLSHEDPNLQGHTVLFLANLMKNEHEENGVKSKFEQIINFISTTSSNQSLSKAIEGIRNLLPFFLQHRKGELYISSVENILKLTKTVTYWSTQIDLVSCLSEVDWRFFHALSPEADVFLYEERALEYFLACLSSKDERVREGCLKFTFAFSKNCYGPKAIHKVHSPEINRLELITAKYVNHCFEESTEEPFDLSTEWFISFMTNELLKSVDGPRIASICGAIFILLKKYPSAKTWVRKFDHPSPPLLFFVLQTCEIYSEIVDWQYLGRMLKLASKLMVKWTQTLQLKEPVVPAMVLDGQKRLANLIVRYLKILHIVLIEAKIDALLNLESEKRTLPVVEDDQKVRGSSPSFARKLRNSIPFNNSRPKEHVPKATSPVVDLEKNSDEVPQHEFYKKVNQAYQTSKIQTSKSSNLSDLLSGVLESLQILLENIEFSVISEFAEIILTSLTGLLQSTYDDLPSKCIFTATSVLSALFQVKQPPNESQLPSSYEADLVEKLRDTPLSLISLRLTDAQATTQAGSHLSESELNHQKSYKQMVDARLQEINFNAKKGSSSVQDFIRIFEPIVICAMRRYTVSTDERIQKAVLKLLTNLMQLRVNYSLLDSEGIFVKILLNQLSTAEANLWRDAKMVIPSIFLFLVLLSGEKKGGAKTFVTKSEVINLCNSLNAAGLSPETHAIPALSPIVDDIFSLETVSESAQKEVILSMILNMSTTCSSFPLLIHILKYYRLTDINLWRSVSARIVHNFTGNLFIENFVLNLKFSDKKELELLRVVFEHCTGGVLEANEDSFKDMLDNALIALKRHKSSAISKVLFGILHLVISQSNLHGILSKINMKSIFSELLKYSDESLKFETLVLIQHISRQQLVAESQLIPDLTLESTFCPAIRLHNNFIASDSTYNNTGAKLAKIFNSDFETFSCDELLIQSALKSTRTRSKLKNFLKEEQASFKSSLSSAPAYVRRHMISLIESDVNVDEDLVKVTFEGNRIGAIRKLVKLLAMNKVAWAETVGKYVQLIPSRRLRLEISTMFDCPFSIKVGENDQKSSSNTTLLVESRKRRKLANIFDDLCKTDCLDDEIYDNTIKNLEEIFSMVGIDSLISFSFLSNCPDSVLVRKILSILSYTPGKEELFRKPLLASEIGEPNELEDKEIITQSVRNFRAFGYGTRTCFLSLWTGLQQVIMSKTSSDLNIGSGREEEIDSMVDAVRGLTVLTMLAFRQFQNGKTFAGSPAVSPLINHPRCPLPRVLDAQAESDLSSSLQNSSPWLSSNPESQGPSIVSVGASCAPNHFRKQGISPMTSARSSSAEIELEASEKSDDSWTPDLNSSTQFLFDLFLRWFHFAIHENSEAPHRRVLLEAARAINMIVNAYPTREHFNETLKAVTGLVQTSNPENEDPLLWETLLPCLTKAASVAGYNDEFLTKTLTPLVSRGFCSISSDLSVRSSVLNLLDMPRGLTVSYSNFLTLIANKVLTSLSAHPSLMSLNPIDLQLKLYDFSIALLIIERHPDFADEVDFTSNIISIIAKSATLGLPSKPSNLFYSIGADLSMANDSYLASTGSTLATSSLLCYFSSKKRSASFIKNKNSSDIGSDPVISVILNSAVTNPKKHSSKMLALLKLLFSEISINERVLNKLFIELMNAKEALVPSYLFFLSDCFRIFPQRDEIFNWLLLAIPNICQKFRGQSKIIICSLISAVENDRDSIRHYILYLPVPSTFPEELFPAAISRLREKLAEEKDRAKLDETILATQFLQKG